MAGDARPTSSMHASILLPIIIAFPLTDREPVDLRPLDQLLEEAVRDRAFPGCAAAVGKSRELLWQGAFGHLDFEGGAAVTARSLYDVASLTKVLGTTAVVMALVRDQKLAVADPVAKHIPEFAGGGRERVTVEHLLTHSSGLPAWKPLFQEATGYGAIFAAVLATRLESDPGREERYSDLGFIVLGEVAQRAGGQSLPDLEKSLVFAPLGLKETLRNPPASLLPRIAPTEKRPPRPGSEGQGSPPGRLEATRGTVHDENAAAGDGVTGHAGLFSTVEDLSLLAAELLRGYRGESRIFSRELVQGFVTRRGLVPGSSRALGWDTPSAGSSAGRLLSPKSFGHTGFTGTSMWLDPERDLYIILLSNRVHPTRENRKIDGVRRRFAEGAVLCLEGKMRRL